MNRLNCRRSFRRIESASENTPAAFPLGIDIHHQTQIRTPSGSRVRNFLTIRYFCLMYTHFVNVLNFQTETAGEDVIDIRKLSATVGKEYQYTQ